MWIWMVWVVVVRDRVIRSGEWIVACQESTAITLLIKKQVLAVPSWGKTVW